MILAKITINAVVFYASDEGFNDTYAWYQSIMSFSPPQYQMDKKYGGYCKMNFGSITLSPDLFSDDWPPPVECAIVIQYLADDETDETEAETIFDGIAYLAAPGITADSVIYDLYTSTYDVNLLSETTDYNGDTVVLPRAFGAVTHVTPVRLADVGGKPTYHKGYISSEVIGTNWDVFDDGVNINANVTDHLDGTFELSAEAVGEVTMSGTSGYGDPVVIIAWACAGPRLNLPFVYDEARSPSPDVNFWANSQMPLIDFLSDLCAFFTHLFYVKLGTFHLVDLGEDNGSRTLTEYEFIYAEYKYNPPVAIIRAIWQTRAAVDETIGKYIKTTDHETFQESIYPYGEDMTVTPYHDTKANIETALAAILVILHKPYCEITLPMQGDLPDPGEKISWTDTQTVEDISAVIRCRTSTYDPDMNEARIIGEGSIS